MLPSTLLRMPSRSPSSNILVSRSSLRVVEVKWESLLNLASYSAIVIFFCLRLRNSVSLVFWHFEEWTYDQSVSQVSVTEQDLPRIQISVSPSWIYTANLWFSAKFTPKWYKIFLTLTIYLLAVTPSILPANGAGLISDNVPTVTKLPLFLTTTWSWSSWPCAIGEVLHTSHPYLLQEVPASAWVQTYCALNLHGLLYLRHLSSCISQFHGMQQGRGIFTCPGTYIMCL